MINNISIIQSIGELEELKDKQGAEILCLPREVKLAVELLENQKKQFTIFTILDENDGSNAYIVAKYRIVNVIGYYVLEGKYELKDDYLEY